jgi:hypothetical protein
MKYTVEMASCDLIYIPRFMKIGIGIQAILRFRLRNFEGCNTGITDSNSNPLALKVLISKLTDNVSKIWGCSILLEPCITR